MLHQARSLNDLRVPYGNRLEALKDDRKGQHSIRINDQWRVCFRWLGEDALARALGVPPRRINEIVLEKRGLTADTALRLARLKPVRVIEPGVEPLTELPLAKA